MTTIFFHPSLLLLIFGSGIWDGNKSGSGINILDPQLWLGESAVIKGQSVNQSPRPNQ